MGKRKIRDEADARRCIEAQLTSGLTLAALTRRETHAWGVRAGGGFAGLTANERIRPSIAERGSHVRVRRPR